MTKKAHARALKSGGTQCRCENCTETAINLATKVARRTGSVMNVVETKDSGICIYDDVTALAKKAEIIRTIFNTRDTDAVA